MDQDWKLTTWAKGKTFLLTQKSTRVFRQQLRPRKVFVSRKKEGWQF